MFWGSWLHLVASLGCKRRLNIQESHDELLQDELYIKSRTKTDNRLKPRHSATSTELRRATYRCQLWLMMTSANRRRAFYGLRMREADWASVGDGEGPEEVGITQEQDMLRQPATCCYSYTDCSLGFKHFFALARVFVSKF